MAVTIVGLGGSLSQQSTSLAAVRVALAGAADAGAKTELFDVRDLALPMYVPDDTDIPAEALRFRESVYACDGILWSSPLYHGTISGSFSISRSCAAAQTNSKFSCLRAPATNISKGLRCSP